MFLNLIPKNKVASHKFASTENKLILIVVLSEPGGKWFIYIIFIFILYYICIDIVVCEWQNKEGQLRGLQMQTQLSGNTTAGAK